MLTATAHPVLIFVPFIAFGLAFLVGAIFLWRIARKVKGTVTETATGKVIRLESPLGSLNVTPHAELDERLATVLLYPGAQPTEPGVANYETQFRFGQGGFHEITASYWTADPESVVWAFYRRELPSWSENLAKAVGHELVEHAEGYMRVIRVLSKDGRTVIETGIKPAEYGDFLQARLKSWAATASS